MNVTLCNVYKKEEKILRHTYPRDGPAALVYLVLYR